MNWDDLRIFLAVARAGQILGAARRLGLNHATVSRRLQALEGEIGAKLFRRVPQGSPMTEAGLALLPVAERMEAEWLAARAAVGGEAEAISGTVRVGAPDGFGTAFLARHLGALTAEHPDLCVQLVPVPLSFSLSRREADLAVTVERPTEGRLVAGKLVDYSLALYASRAYVEAHGMPEEAAALSSHRLVGYVPDLVASPSLDYASGFGVAWNAGLSVSSALGQVEAVRSGAGIGILHSFIARGHPELVPLPGFAPVRRAYWLVYHESVRSLARVQAVAGFISRMVERERTVFS